MDFNWKGLLGSVAPLLGTAIGGPFGALAGVAIKTALGLASDSTEDQMKAAMANATPEQLLALQNAERQFKLDMQKLNVDILKLDVDDRNSARQREMTIKDKLPAILAVGVTVGFFGLLGGMMWGPAVPTGSGEVLTVMIGSLGASWTAIISYYFGSSASSKNKDQLLYNSAPATK